MKNTLKSKLAGLVVAATFAATGTAALANADDVIPAEHERHGDEISTLAHDTESGPGKGAIISEAARAHGKATSEAAKQGHDVGLETAAAAKTDGQAFGATKAEAGKARRR